MFIRAEMVHRFLILLGAAALIAPACSLDWSTPPGATGGGGGAASTGGTGGAGGAGGHDGVDPRCCAVCIPLPSSCSADHVLDAAYDNSCDPQGWVYEPGARCLEYKACGECANCAELPSTQETCNDLGDNICNGCVFN